MHGSFARPLTGSARVVLFTSAKKWRDHMFLTVAADGGRFVVDPGFSPFAARSPVPMDGTTTPRANEIPCQCKKLRVAQRLAISCRQMRLG
jgi:arylamine N-acetyltransferase